MQVLAVEELVDSKMKRETSAALVTDSYSVP